jgi:hypothetical protein
MVSPFRATVPETMVGTVPALSLVRSEGCLSGPPAFPLEPRYEPIDSGSCTRQVSRSHTATTPSRRRISATMPLAAEAKAPRSLVTRWRAFSSARATFAGRKA